MSPRNKRSKKRKARSRSKRSGGQKALAKVERCIKHNATSRALELLDAHWPREGGAPGEERLRWLFERWPERAVVELGALGEEARAAALEEHLPGRVLALTPSEWEALAALDHPLVEEARVVREASADISAGRDAAGLERLKAVGLRSPFRQARLMLRGLSALYGGQSEEAARCLGRLTGSPHYGPAAAQLLGALGEEVADHAPGARARLPEDHPMAVDLGFEAVRAHLAEGEPNQALRAAAKIPASVDSVARSALRRALLAWLWRHQHQVHPEDHVERVTRALGQEPDDPDGHRLKALAWEVQKDDEGALEYWGRYDKRMQNRKSAAGFDAGAARGAVAARSASHHASMAQDEEDYRNSMPWGRSHTSPLRGEAVEQLRRATELDPDEPGHWLALTDALRKAGDDAERGRTLEEMVDRFEGRPDIWRMAANAAADRRSFHKARRHLEEAIALEPMSRDLRDLEAEILLDTARKYYYKDKLGRAEETFDEAHAVPYRTAGSRLKTAAELASFHELRGRPGRYGDIRAEALAEDARPWLFAGFVIFAREYLAGRGVGRRQGVPSAVGRRVDILDEIDDEGGPDGEEVARVLELGFAFDQEFDGRLDYYDGPFNPRSRFYPLLEYAIGMSGHLLPRQEHLSAALLVADTNILRYDIARAAHERFPDNDAFLSHRYFYAVHSKQGPEAFEGAIERLEAARQSYLDMAPPAPEGVPPMFAELLGHGGEHPNVKVFSNLIDDVTKHLASLDASP